MIELWELSPSPNNTKVRMALRFKGLDFQAHEIDRVDRTAVMDVSGQELTPVIRDGKMVLNDSEAILHYLDANYRQAPRLMPASRAGYKESNDWKALLDEKVAGPWFPVFLYGIGRKDELDKESLAAYQEALRWLEATLGDGDSFKGPELPICDLRAAEWAVYAMPGKGLIARAPIYGRFKELFGVGDDELPKLRRFLAPWNERLA